MRLPFALLLLHILETTALPAWHVKKFDDTLPIGFNPISDFTVDFLGVQTANNSCSHRDLGFTGSIAGKWYAIYGDTLWCQPGVTDPAQDAAGFHGMVRDSISAVTDSALFVEDLHLNDDSGVPHQLQFVPYNTSWGEDDQTGFGASSLVEVNGATAEGAMFYVVNANAAGLKGAGVAKVQVINGLPTVTERLDSTGRGFWWNATTHARYGDISAFRDPLSDYIYAWGGAPTTITGYVDSNYVYLARVNATEAYDLTKYEYWNGPTVGWVQGQPLTTFNSDTAVMWDVGQGQVVWSPFFKCYVFVHLGDCKVALRTAPSPEGPWSPDVNVYTPQVPSGGYVYAAVAHPYLDTTGQTLTVSYTNLPNRLEVIKISFNYNKHLFEAIV